MTFYLQTFLCIWVPSSCSSCPIALAVNREFPKFTPYVTSDLEMVPVEGTWDDSWHSRLPRSATRFLKNFDRYGKNAVTPFRFYVEVPNAS